MPDLVGRKPVKIAPRSDLDPEEFRKFIFEKGLRCSWEMACDCPCVRGSQAVALDFGFSAIAPQHTTSEARANCQVCNGKGYFYQPGQEVRAAFTSAMTEPERFAAWGEYARGMVSITVLPENIPGLFDRFTLTDSILLFRESRRRADTVEELRYPIASRTVDLQAGPATYSVLYAQRTNIAGVTTAADSMVEGVDFAVVDGKIDWTLGDGTGKAPVVGAWYSMCYYAAPRYVVVDYPHSFRDTWIQKKTPEPTFAPLPVNVMARLDFYRKED